MRNIVLYVVIAFMSIILIYGLKGAYIGLRLLLHVRKNYPDKLLKYIFYPIGQKALEEELCSKDSYFKELNEKARGIQKVIFGATGCVVLLALVLLIIALVFRGVN